MVRRPSYYRWLVAQFVDDRQIPVVMLFGTELLEI